MLSPKRINIILFAQQHQSQLATLMLFLQLEIRLCLLIKFALVFILETKHFVIANRMTQNNDIVAKASYQSSPDVTICQYNN